MTRSPSGAILAGGAAARVGGAAKGLFRVGGERIIDRVAATLRPVARELIVVSNSDDALKWLPDARVVRDQHEVRATLVGIHAALSAVEGDVIVAGWDMPFLSTALFHYMAAQRDGTVAAVVAESDRGLEGCAALYTRAALPTIERLIVEGRFALSEMLAELPAIHVVPAGVVARYGDPGRIFTNVNTHDDLDALGPPPPRDQR